MVAERKNMVEIIYPNPPIWYIAYTGQIFSTGFVDEDQCMASGLEILETFLTEDECNARLIELGFVTQ